MEQKRIYVDLTQAGLASGYAERYADGTRRGQERLESGREAFTGWYDLPLKYDKGELRRILDTAEKIRKQCDVLVVIGIGGSYLGTKAAWEFLKPSAKKGHPELLFAGQNLSGRYHRELLEKVRDKEVCLCVISKSGTTAEPGIAFGIMKSFLREKYGEAEMKRRIYAVTDARKGVLRDEADREGYETFVVPDDIGGRYSVLSPVGLLPLAAAGLDVQAMLEGAAAERRCVNSGTGKGLDDGARYAIVRNALYEQGKVIEVFESYEPCLRYFIEWLKQLFGESEGKEGKGLFPAGLQFSTDLHSVGQFIQEGAPIIFETILDLEDVGEDLEIPADAGAVYAGKTMREVNRAVLEGVAVAHSKAGVPVLRIVLPASDAYTFGSAVWFFERACALSAYLLGVNPFDQPGVEQYKKEMKLRLAKEE